VEFNPEGLDTPPLPAGQWPIRSIALDLSGRCNMACRYCAEAATLPARPPMPEGMIDAALGLLAPAEMGGMRSVRLGSGEPLLALPLMEYLVHRITESDEPRTRPYITTNGTLLTREVRDWLIDSGWDVKISLDGPQAIHDRWRQLPGGLGTHDRIEEAAVDLARRLPVGRFSVTAVLCRGADPQQVFDGIAALGVRRIELVPVVHKDPAVLPSAGDVRAYEQFVVDHARRYLQATDPEELADLPRLTSYVRKLMGYELFGASCGAGRNLVGVGPDGSLYPCFRFIGADGYKLGRLPHGVDPLASLAFQRGPGRTYHQRATCRHCWAAPLCGGPCFACAEMFGPGKGQPIDLHCAYELATARAAVWLVDQLRQHDPDRLLGFLPFDPGELLA
jgi:uncharacterized protein